MTSEPIVEVVAGPGGVRLSVVRDSWNYKKLWSSATAFNSVYANG